LKKIKNTAGPVGQAVALHITGDRVVFRNCKLLGHRDTLYCAGENSRQYFSHCHIQGTTDFIFGEATVLFDECTIHSLSDSYITAASTPMWKEFGFVFLNCNLTADPSVSKAFLGRPWRDFANVAFLDCQMGRHISPKGWANWSNTSRNLTARYSEFNNSGPGSELTSRIAWSRQLNADEASRFNIENILAPSCDQQTDIEMWISRQAESE
jgi:pectinesterase